MSSIPCNLLKLIDEGTAKSKTAVIGWSGSNILQVPDGCYIVITNFKYFYFIPYVGVDMSALSLTDMRDKLIKHSVQQIRFKSVKSNNHFVIRCPFELSKDSAGGNVIKWKTGGYADFGTYLVHESDVSISICTCPDLTLLDNEYEIAPQGTNKSEAPCDYGVDGSTFAFPAVQKVDNDVFNGFVNLPLTSKYTPVVADRYNFCGMELPVDHFTSLENWQTNTVSKKLSQYLNFPIVNIQYVEIPKPDKSIMASS